MQRPDPLSDPAYLRARSDPKPGDSGYLHLKDLRLFLEDFSTDEKIKVLDFGCGGSPYRSLFPNADYRRADLDETSGVDYAVGVDSAIAAPDGTFDLILSTQVLEHVAEPGRYLRECHRLLRPGGRLILTTHGLYAEHDCPDDFFRWTSHGLERVLLAAEFHVEALEKLTTNSRAMLQLLEQHQQTILAPRWHFFGLWVQSLRFLFDRFLSSVHRWSDRFHGPCSRVLAAEAGHSLFVALGAMARK